MKDLSKIPTPETDAARTFQDHIIACKSLERRLTVAREALTRLLNEDGRPMSMRAASPKSIINEALTLTAPKP